MSQEHPCMQRLRLRGGVEDPPFDRSTVERSAVALRPVSDLRCSTGAACSGVQQPLEVQGEVPVSSHETSHLLRGGAIPNLRDGLAVTTVRRTLAVPIPACRSEAEEAILSEAEDLVQSRHCHGRQDVSVLIAGSNVDVDSARTCGADDAFIPKLTNLRQRRGHRPDIIVSVETEPAVDDLATLVGDRAVLLHGDGSHRRVVAVVPDRARLGVADVVEHLSHGVTATGKLLLDRAEPCGAACDGRNAEPVRLDIRQSRIVVRATAAVVRLVFVVEDGAAVTAGVAAAAVRCILCVVAVIAASAAIAAVSAAVFCIFDAAPLRAALGALEEFLFEELLGHNALLRFGYSAPKGL